MTINVNQQDLAFLYEKAKQKYAECINNKENQFLKDEVGYPLESILVIEKDIKIVFTQNISDKYLLELNLELYVGGKEIGRYVL